MRRLAVRIVLWTGATMGALLGAALCLCGIANTDPGRRLLERATASLSHDRVQLSGLAGRLPDDLRLGTLRLSDANGSWLYAEGMTLRWAPSQLLHGRISVAVLRAERLDVERRPLPNKTPSHSNSWWRHFEVGQLEVARLNLGAPLAGTAALLTVRAHGRMNSADDTLLEAEATRLDSEGHYALRYRADTAGLDGELQLDEPADAALAHLLQLPNLGAVHVSGRLTGERNLPRLELVATAGALRATAGGNLDWQRRSADLTFSIRSANMAPRADLAWHELMADGRWQGGIDAPNVTVKFALVGLRAAGGSVESLHAEARGHAGAVHVTATANQLQLPGAHPRLFAGAPLELQAESDLRGQPRRITFALTHPLLQVRGVATLGEETEASAALQFARLAPFAELAGLQLEGAATLNIRFAGRSDEGHLSAEGTLRVPGGAAPLPALIGRDASVKTSIAWNGTQLRIDEARLTGANLTASASGGRSARGDWDLAWRAALQNLGFVAQGLQGKASAAGRLRGDSGNLRADARIDAEPSINGSKRAPLQATLAAEHLTTEPEGHVDVHGSLDGAPLQLSAALHRDGVHTVHVEVSRGEWKSARLSGTMAWPVTAAASARGPVAPRGRLELRIGRLEDLYRFTGQPLPGQLTVSLDAPGTASDAMQLVVHAENLQFSGLTGNAQIRATGSFEQLALDAALQVRGMPGSEARFVSKATVNLAQRRMVLNLLRADYQQQQLQLRAPAHIDFSDGLAVDGLRAAWQDAQLEVDGRVLPVLAVRVALRDLKPSVLAPHLQAAGIDVAQLPAEGKLSLHADLKGSLAAPSGTLSLKAIDLRWQQGIAAALPALSVSVNTELRGHEPARVAAELRSGSGTELSVNGLVPIDQRSALALRVQGRADLSLANGFLEAAGRRASGQARIDGTIEGTAAAPRITGTVSVNKGELRDYVQGIRLSAITATLEARDGALQITHFSARAGQGEIRASGSIGVLQAGVPIDVRFTGRNAQPIASNLLTAQVDGDLHLRGSLLKRLDLSGTVQVRRAEVTIPNALPASVATLDVRRPGQKQPPAPPPSRFELGFDLTVNSPRAVFVRGRGLDAELGGELHVGGTRQAPQVRGGFELREGRFNLAGKRLDFQSGRLTFTGQGITRQFDPALDFVASNVSGGITSTLKVSGYADAPVITLESNPELPQDEVLSQLLFGTSVTQLSALQLAQMAAAVASLGGVGGTGGSGALLSLQRSLGLDRLAVSGSDAGSGGASGATVEAGRYISRRVYVGTKQSTTGGSQAEVEIDLSRRLKLHTVFGNNAGTAQGTTSTDQAGNTVGLSYEFEY